MSLPPELLLRMYRALAGSRIAEEAITDLSGRGILPLHHSGLGHECIGVGVGLAVRNDDCVQGSPRSGMMLAHARGGFTLRDAVESKFGRVPNCLARVDGRPRALPIVGLVGTWVPMSVGVAMADLLHGRSSVTVSFFGDGAASEGAVHEALNLASVRRLPMLFVAENNGMAVSMSFNESTRARDLASRAPGYGMPAVKVDGQDVIAVYEAATEAISRARRGDGPTLLEAVIDRWEPHAVGLKDLRAQEQINHARARDGLRKLRETLIAAAILTPAEVEAIASRCALEISHAVEACTRDANTDARSTPFTELSAAEQTYPP